MTITSMSLGSTGAPGRPGNGWRVSLTSPPATTLGIIDDLCICADTNAVWKKYASGWAITSIVLIGAEGPPGWAPLFGIVTDSDRRVLQIADWVGDGAVEDKPAIGGYLGAAGIVATAAEAVDIRGAQGIQGVQGIQGRPYAGISAEGNTAGRDAYDAEAEGFAYRDTTLDKVFVKASDTSGDWDIGMPVLQGPDGPQGDAGWTPELAIVSDGARRVLQIVDWFGGAGTKPATGKYIGATGLEDAIEDGVDIRGGTGATGGDGPTGADGAPYHGIDAEGNTAGRAAYDDEPIGFTYHDTEADIIYVKLSGDSADWDLGVEVLQGPEGPAVPLSDALPLECGAASAGVDTEASRSDHVHPPVDLGDATQITGTLPIGNGGTGGTTAEAARIALGLGTIAVQNANDVNIDGGAIDDTDVGATTAKTGRFTTLTATTQIVMPAGVVGTPGIYPTGDTDTGLWSPAANVLAASAAGAEICRINSTELLVGKTASTFATPGVAIFKAGALWVTADGGASANFNRLTSDGIVIAISQDSTAEGDIRVAGTSVTLTSMSGSHFAQLAHHEVAEILEGSILDTIDEMCRWLALEWTEEVPAVTREITRTIKRRRGRKMISEEVGTGKHEVVTPAQTVKGHVLCDPALEVGSQVEHISHLTGQTVMATVVEETNRHLPRVEVSRTAGSRRVAGVFRGWDPQEDGSNPASDLLDTGVGLYLVRVQAGQEPEGGDLLDSAGDGTARVQADDIIRSSTIGKIAAAVPAVVDDAGNRAFQDGSRLFPCYLYCG